MRTLITYSHIQRLFELESSISYNQPPPDGQEPFTVIENDSPILLSAPHGARTHRESGWHEEDEYTAGMALLLGEICRVSVIATNYRNEQYDPNHTVGGHLPYKQELGRLIHQHAVHYVLDLHGAGLNSPTLSPQQTIDLGLRQRKNIGLPSMKLKYVEKLESLLRDTGQGVDPVCFLVGRNKFPGATPGTIISYVVEQTIAGTDQKLQAMQIEMKPQVRVAKRFETSSEYRNGSGIYQAPEANVMHMLQALADFIEYLKVSDV